MLREVTPPPPGRIRKKPDTNLFFPRRKKKLGMSLGIISISTQANHFRSEEFKRRKADSVNQLHACDTRARKKLLPQANSGKEDAYKGRFHYEDF
jgi:hypothetical protein